MAKSRPNKTEPRMDAQRVAQAILSRTAVRGLTADTLASYLEQFDLGYLRQAAIAWQKIRDRDDTVKAVAEKRELDCALLDYEILPVDDSPEALTHKAALEEFYAGITATHALDQNQRGGISTLIRQMMHSVGHKYAVHEIVWQPEATGLTAEFRFVPLQFLENTQGRLRFLAQDYASQGEDLEEGGWMVTTGAGLMEATSIAYLFKQQPLRAWLILCDKFAVPYLHGKTPAAFGSNEWNAFRDALGAFVSDGAICTSPNTEITPIQITGAETASATLVDRMDRAIARLWRGADLSTMSQKGSANGSNPQQTESEILAAADAQIISETLNHYVDQWVIRYRFGATTPKAYFQLQPQVECNQDLEIKIDQALIGWGVPRGKKDLLEKYGRPEPDPGDELVSPPEASKPVSPGASKPVSSADGGKQAEVGKQVSAAADKRKALGNESGLSASELTSLPAYPLTSLTTAQQAVLAPVQARIDAIAALTDPEAQRSALDQLGRDLPELARSTLAQTPSLARVWAQALSPAALDGWFSPTQAAVASSPISEPTSNIQH